jgi:hypothetical protein
VGTPASALVAHFLVLISDRYRCILPAMPDCNTNRENVLAGLAPACERLALRVADAGKRGTVPMCRNPFAGTARRVLHTNGDCPLVPSGHHAGPSGGMRLLSKPYGNGRKATSDEQVPRRVLALIAARSDLFAVSNGEGIRTSEDTSVAFRSAKAARLSRSERRQCDN